MLLNFKKYGESGKSLIILHGLFGSLDNWQLIAKSLSNRYQVFVFDLRNHGKSNHTSIFSIELMSIDVVEMISFLKIQDPILIGHSMGGKVAMHCALNNQNLIKSIVIIDISPRKYKRGHDDIFSALLSCDLSKFNTRKDIEQHLKYKIEDEATLQFLLKNIKRSDDLIHFSWKMNLQALHEHYDEVINEITHETKFKEKTLFIQGERSNYLGKDEHIYIDKVFLNYVIVKIKNAGHWVHADNPSELVEVINSFLDINEENKKP